MADPDHLLHSQVLAEALLDLRAPQRGVPVRVQQALLGGDQRALTVDRDRVALEHEVGREPLDPEMG